MSARLYILSCRSPPLAGSFYTVAACSWSRFFFWVILQASPPLGDDTLYMASGEFIVNATGDPKYAECNLEYCEEYIKCDTLPE
jgi:hypothetical protein